MCIGQIVFSKCGRDKGQPFVIVSIEGGYVYLADGKTRPFSKPKKKKQKHVQPTHWIESFSEAAADVDIRRILKSVYTYGGGKSLV